MNSTAALFVFLVATQSDPDVGQVLGTFGNVTIQRQADSIPVESGATLVKNDRVISGQESGVMLRGIPGAAIYLGRQSQLILLGHEENDLQLSLGVGEIRISPASNSIAEVQTDLATGKSSGAGVLRAQVQTEFVRFWAEKGPSIITLAPTEDSQQQTKTKFSLAGFFQGANSLTLQQGQSVTVRKGEGFGDVESADPHQWTITPSEFALAIAGGSGSRLQPDPVRSPVVAPRTFFREEEFTPASQGFNSQISLTSGINLTLGKSIRSAATGSSGGTFADASQSTPSGQLVSGIGQITSGSPFPGNIHLVTGETAYAFEDVLLQSSDMFPTMSEHWSIGLGPVPLTQVSTNIFTGTNPSPTAIQIPKFDAYILRLDQFSTPDPVTVGTSPTAAVGVVGLVGSDPTSPTVVGANPLSDERAKINEAATFALGEFVVRMDAGSPVISMRRSDQDRRIVKDPGGNDDNDRVEVNTDVSQFDSIVDLQFFGGGTAVYVPANDSLRNLPQYSRSTQLRKAAFTVLAAERLQHIAQRTGQTRFVVDGSIVDITGYKP